MSEKLHLIFHVEGQFTSPANYRAVNLAKSCSHFGCRVAILADDRNDNKRFATESFPANINLVWLPRASKLLYLVIARRFIRSNHNAFVIQSNPTYRAFCLLVLSSSRVIGEFDEPEILKSQSPVRKFIAHVLHWWFVRRCVVKITATKYFQTHVFNSHYIPHAQYISVPKIQKQVQCQFDLAYLGNLYSLWDHDLIFDGLARAQRANYVPKTAIIGSGPEYNKWVHFCKVHELQNVFFLGFMELSQYLPILAETNILLFPMRDTPINKSRCPSKLFSYAAANRPILAHRVGEICGLVPESPYLVDPDVDLISVASKLNSRLPSVNYNNIPNYDKLALMYIDLAQTVL